MLEDLENLSLIDAEELKELTLTPEQLHLNKKNQMLDSIMSTMTKMATQSGKTQYMCHFTTDDEAQKLLSEIKQVFESLKYKTTSSQGTVGNQEVTTLTIDWS